MCRCSSGAGGIIRNTRKVELAPRGDETIVEIIRQPAVPTPFKLVGRTIRIYSLGEKFVVKPADLAPLRAGGWIA